MSCGHRRTFFAILTQEKYLEELIIPLKIQPEFKFKNDGFLGDRHSYCLTKNYNNYSKLISSLELVCNSYRAVEDFNLNYLAIQIIDKKSDFKISAQTHLVLAIGNKSDFNFIGDIRTIFVDNIETATNYILAENIVLNCSYTMPDIAGIYRGSIKIFGDECNKTKLYKTLSYDKPEDLIKEFSKFAEQKCLLLIVMPFFDKDSLQKDTIKFSGKFCDAFDACSIDFTFLYTASTHLVGFEYPDYKTIALFFRAIK